MRILVLTLMMSFLSHSAFSSEGGAKRKQSEGGSIGKTKHLTTVAISQDLESANDLQSLIPLDLDKVFSQTPQPSSDMS